jgi:hypothetical protein
MWFLIAPSLLTLSLAAVPPAMPLLVKSLVGSAYLGLPLCIHWGARGWFFCSCILFVVSIALFWILPEISIWWLVGLVVSCLMSLWTAIPLSTSSKAQTISETAMPQTLMVAAAQEHAAALNTQQNAFAKAKVLWQEERSGYLLEIERLKDELKQLDISHQDAVMQNASFSAEIQRLSLTEEQQASLQDCLQKRLIHLQQEYDDLQACYQYVNAEWQKLIDPPAVALADMPLSEGDDPVLLDRDRRHYRGLYVQLREQFALKSQTLDDTRTQLFLAEEALAAKVIDCASAAADNSEVQLNLAKEIIRQAAVELALADESYLAEVEILQRIVAKLS